MLSPSLFNLCPSSHKSVIANQFFLLLSPSLFNLCPSSHKSVIANQFFLLLSPSLFNLSPSSHNSVAANLFHCATSKPLQFVPLLAQICGSQPISLCYLQASSICAPP